MPQSVNEYPLSNRTSYSLDAFQRSAILSMLVERIAELSPKQKKILAMYYHEEMQMAEIAARLNLAEPKSAKCTLKLSLYCTTIS
jgi:DNA-directed RNA polymerase specialized sigma subunit